MLVLVGSKLGAGAFPDVASAVHATLTRAPLDVPEPNAHLDYAQPYQRFRQSFIAARPDLLAHG